MTDSATIITSQIRPSPPELSTPFPQDTATEGGGVGGSVGAGVMGGMLGSTVGARVGGAVGSRVGIDDDPAVGEADGARVTVGIAVLAVPLGATRDGRTAVEGWPVASGAIEPEAPRGEGVRDSIAPDMPGDGVIVGTATVGVAHSGAPTSAKPDAIPPSQVVTTIATKGPR